MIGVKLLIGVGLLTIISCSSATIKKTDMRSDFAQGKFEKYDKILENNFEFEVLEPCAESEYHERNCVEKPPATGKFYIRSYSKENLESEIERGKKLFAELRARENKYLDSKGNILDTNSTAWRYDLSPILDANNNYRYRWNYVDPVRIAYEKLQEAQSVESEKIRIAEQEKLEAERKRELSKLEPLRKKYGLADIFPPKYEFAVLDHRLIGKSYIFEIAPQVMTRKDYYKGYCSNLPCFIGSTTELENFQKYKVIGKIVAYDVMVIGGTSLRVPIILVRHILKE